MRFLNHNLFTGDITVNGTTTLSTATGVTRATGDNSTHLATTAFVKAQGYATTAALAGYVPTSRTLTINGTTYDLSANRSWTISTADGYISNVQVVGSTLSFTGVGSAFSGIVDLSTLTPTVRTVYETVKNVSGATILKGTPLAVVAGQTSGNVSDVVPADAADPTKMPAVFIANENIADQAEGEVVLFGNITGINTSAFTSGTTVYVAPGGGWTATKPVWPNLIQNLGVITKQHATNGAGIVTGVGRANALPNLTAGKIWVGSATYPIESTTVHVDEANGRVGIGTTSPSTNLHVAGTARVTGSRFDLNSGTRITGQYYVNGNTEYTYIDMYNGGNASINIGTKHPLSYISFESGSGAYTERMRITNTGNVGIGTTSPVAALHVQSSATKLFLSNTDFNTSTSTGSGLILHTGTSSGNTYGQIYAFQSGNTSYANLVVPGGNVGIGTTSPSEKLEVIGNIKLPVTTGNGLLFTTGSAPSGLTWYTQPGVADGPQLVSYGSVHVILDSDNNDNDSRFFTIRKNGTNFGNTTELFRVAESGNVGIGTTSPSYKLEVNSVAQSTVAKFRTSDNNYSTIEVGDTGDVYASVYMQTDSGNGQLFKYGSGWGTESGMVGLYSSNGSIALQAGGSTKVFVASGGNVGIGTTSPTNKFQVANGNMSITSGYSFILADTDTNWRLGRNIIVESGNYLTGSTFQLVAANAASEGWQFVNDDGFTVLEIGAETSARHVWVNAGNLSVGVASPQEKIHVAGNVRIDGGSTAAILETNNATAAEAGTTYRTFTTADHYAVFVDYVVYDTGRTNMRTGTFRAVWSTGDVVYTDVSTVDLGATDNVVLSAAISGANVNLIVTGPTDYTLKYNLKVIK